MGGKYAKYGRTYKKAHGYGASRCGTLTTRKWQMTKTERQRLDARGASREARVERAQFYAECWRRRQAGQLWRDVWAWAWEVRGWTEAPDKLATNTRRWARTGWPA
jgi:hypothetical protein